MVLDSMMKTSSWSTQNQVFWVWLMLAKIQMAHNFSSQLWSHHGWMDVMLYSVRCSKAWILFKKLKGNQRMLETNQERMLSSPTVAHWALASFKFNGSIFSVYAFKSTTECFSHSFHFLLYYIFFFFFNFLGCAISKHYFEFNKELVVLRYIF